jgi:3D (Asp-Asp-Asp) domain-containing protein
MRLLSTACALLAGFSFWQPGVTHAQAASCEMYRITGYVRGADSPWTYDGTSVWSSEPIVAASWNVPINSIVQVQGLGRYRVADRGGKLQRRHIDILVNSKAEAYSLTGWRPVCVLKSGNVKANVNPRAVNRSSSTLTAFTAPTTSKPAPVTAKPAPVSPKP